LNEAADGRITSEKERNVLFVPYYAWANRGAERLRIDFWI
jgi:DUF1680 family protein